MCAHFVISILFLDTLNWSNRHEEEFGVILKWLNSEYKTRPDNENSPSPFTSENMRRWSISRK